MALSERSRTFSTINHAAGSLGLPGEALRLAKHLGCTAFRPNGNVNEREFVSWLLTDCWQFWGEPLGMLDEKIGIFPQVARAWLNTPPTGAAAAYLTEEAFQWLRLIHGDVEMEKVKGGAEDWLRGRAGLIPGCLLDGSAALPECAEAEGVGRDLFRPASFPAVIPVWRFDVSPFVVLRADELEFWQWTEGGVRERCDVDSIPVPPKFLIVPANSEPPPRNCSCMDSNPWLNDHPASERRSLLDFLLASSPGGSLPRASRGRK